jgi:hypothetical protein
MVGVAPATDTKRAGVTRNIKKVLDRYPHSIEITAVGRRNLSGSGNEAMKLFSVVSHGDATLEPVGVSRSHVWLA